MSIEYKTLESPKSIGTLTLKIEDNQLSFNHNHIHERDEYEDFGFDDFGIEMINDRKVYHINGHPISYKEFRFINRVIEDL